MIKRLSEKTRKHEITIILSIAIVAIVLVNLPANFDFAFSEADPLKAMGIIQFKKQTVAPDFTLSDVEGNEISLSNFREKVVFLNFWASWCGPCRTEMPEMQELYSEFKDKELVILAVDVRESRKRVKKFLEDYKLTFPAVVDEDGSVSATYGVRSLPTTYLIDREGKVIGGALRAREWASENAKELIQNLLDKSLVRR